MNIRDNLIATSTSAIETVLNYINMKDELNYAVTSLMKRVTETALKNNLSAEGVYASLAKKVNDDTVISVEDGDCVLYGKVLIGINEGTYDISNHIKCEDYEKFFITISSLCNDLKEMTVFDDSLQDPLYKLTGYSFEMIKQLIACAERNPMLYLNLGLRRKEIEKYHIYSNKSYDIESYTLSDHVKIVTVQRQSKSLRTKDNIYKFLSISDGITAIEIEELTETVEKLINTLLDYIEHYVKSIKGFALKDNQSSFL